MVRRRRWHPSPVLLPGKSHGWRSLVGCSPWGHEESDTTERLHFHFMHWRRKWHPTPVLLPGKSHGWRSLGGCSPWGHKESDTTERLHFHFMTKLLSGEWGRAGRFGAEGPAGAKPYKTEDTKSSSEWLENSCGVHCIVLCWQER